MLFTLFIFHVKNVKCEGVTKHNFFHYPMSTFRYSLEKGSRKYICPNCQKRKLVRYINTVTSEYLPEQYGRCDSEIKCGYHLNPYSDGYVKMIEQQNSTVGNWKPGTPQLKSKSMPIKENTFIPVEVLEKTLTGYGQNVFLQNLLSRVPFPFEVKDVEKVISQYRLGTVCNGYRAGAITFPFIDSRANVRAIQVKQFDVHNYTIGTDFIHSIIDKHCKEKSKALPDWLTAYQKNDIKVSCPFGSHLLNNYPSNPIALVEAPKTAIYGTLYFGFPDDPKNFLWMAVYNLSSLNYEKCKELQGRQVYLFPDLSKNGKAFDLWSRKALELSAQMPGTTFRISDLLESNASATQRENGQDLADYLIDLDWREFRIENVKNEKCEDETKHSFISSHSLHNVKIKPTYGQSTSRSLEGYNVKINSTFFETTAVFDTEEFENWFNSLSQPITPIQLQGKIKVCNITDFVTGRLNHIKAFTNYRELGNRSLFIYQLQQLRNILQYTKFMNLL